METEQANINQLEDVVKEFITETTTFLYEWALPAFPLMLLGIILFVAILIFKSKFNN